MTLPLDPPRLRRSPRLPRTRTPGGLAIAIAPLLLTLAACGDSGTTPVDQTDTTSPGDDTTAPGDDVLAADTEPLPPECTTDDECTDAATPLCDAAGACVGLPRGHQIGWRDGKAESVTLTELYKPNTALEATDLEFHPHRDELWVISRPFHVDGVCAQSNPNSLRCRSLEGRVTILFEPGTPEQRVETRVDYNAWHFMRRPPAMAMGADPTSGDLPPGTWASCSEAATGNFEDNNVLYNGPSLWSSDLSVFAVHPSPGGNGSHLDMLHGTPWCMGIAHERDNVYWLFNGHVGSIDRYDFGIDHGAGYEDHSDGTIHRYAQGALVRKPHTPSHMQFNHADAHLYVVDTGNERIIKLDTTTGVRTGNLTPLYENLAAHGTMGDAVVTEVVGPGTLIEPSGLVLHDGLLFVSDRAASRLFAFELDGTLVRQLDLDVPTGTLGGLEIGPDDKLYLTDMLTGAVYRLDPR